MRYYGVRLQIGGFHRHIEVPEEIFRSGVICAEVIGKLSLSSSDLSMTTTTIEFYDVGHYIRQDDEYIFEAE